MLKKIDRYILKKFMTTFFFTVLIFTMITETFTKEPVQRYVDTLAQNFPDTNILLSGYQIIAQNVQSQDNIRVLQSLGETVSFLDSH